MWTAALLPVAAQGQTTQPGAPISVTAKDHRWDNGTRIDLNWALSIGDAALHGYVIRRKAVTDAAFTRGSHSASTSR
jgi:hypothetical protein